MEISVDRFKQNLTIANDAIASLNSGTVQFNTAPAQIPRTISKLLIR